MQHAIASRVTALIGVALLLGAGLFAWVRSRGRESADTAGVSQPVATRAVGASVYAEECGFCHGNGVEDRRLLAQLADERYRGGVGAVEVVDFILGGLEATSENEIDHPPFDHLTDDQIAALLEYLLAYGPPEETAGARPSISPGDVAIRR